MTSGSVRGIVTSIQHRGVWDPVQKRWLPLLTMKCEAPLAYVVDVARARQITMPSQHDERSEA